MKPSNKSHVHTFLRSWNEKKQSELTEEWMKKKLKDTEEENTKKNETKTFALGSQDKVSYGHDKGQQSLDTESQS